MKPLLSVKNLRMEFGGLVAVKDVSFEVKKGEFIGLIGPNGCGNRRPSIASAAFYNKHRVALKCLERMFQTSDRTKSKNWE